jgi:hypothetical protein
MGRTLLPFCLGLATSVLRFGDSQTRKPVRQVLACMRVDRRPFTNAWWTRGHRAGLLVLAAEDRGDVLSAHAVQTTMKPAR